MHHVTVTMTRQSAAQSVSGALCQKVFILMYHKAGRHPQWALHRYISMILDAPGFRHSKLGCAL